MPIYGHLHNPCLPGTPPDVEDYKTAFAAESNTDDSCSRAVSGESDLTRSERPMNGSFVVPT